MRLCLSFFMLVFSLVAFAPAASGQGGLVTCSCKSPDSTCTPSVSCPHGCTAICGSNDACYAGCASGEVDKSNARITLQLRDKDSETISAALSSASGRRITFTPRKKGLYSIDLNNDPVWDALHTLAKRGKVTVNGWDFRNLEDLRRKTLSGQKVTVSFNGMPVRNVVDDLSFITGITYHVVEGDAQQALSISLEEVTLEEIVYRISEKASVKIEPTEKRASLK